MSTIFRRWKNRLRCSSKRYIRRSRSSSIFADDDFKAVNSTMDKLVQENQMLKERFDKLEERCQRWIADEQIYLLRRIEQLENENRRLQENYQAYQKQSEKCIGSVTDLIIKTFFTQEELRKQCTSLRDTIEKVRMRKNGQQNESIAHSKRSVSCHLESNPLQNIHDNRHTTNDQSTWFHQQLMIVEENDHKTANQPSHLYVSGSQSSICTSTMTAMKSKIRIPSSTGLTNEFYYASHKPDGDNEKTPPVLMRNKQRSSNLQVIPVDNASLTITNRRPVSSPVRSTTYILQQHHRINNNPTNKKLSSPARQQHLQSSTAPMTLTKSRQTQQQCTKSNNEKLPTQTALEIDSTPKSQQLGSRTQTVSTSRRTSPIVKTTPAKTITNPSRSPRITNPSPIRPTRPLAPLSTTSVQQRSPRIPLRPSNLASKSQRTTSSPPTTNKSIRLNDATSKLPEKLKTINNTVVRPRPVQPLVSKSKPEKTNISKIKNNNIVNHTKTQTLSAVQSTALQVSTPRVSDLDAVMAEHNNDNNNEYSHYQIPSSTELKSTVLFPLPAATNIRRSLFSADSVKIVRPIRSQELKLFSCHLTTDPSSSSSLQTETISNENSVQSNTNETRLTSTPILSEQKPDDKSLDDNPLIPKGDTSSTSNSTIMRDLSEDSLNEHYQIRQLLNGTVSTTAVKSSHVQNTSSNEDIPVTCWSHIRSSRGSDIEHIAALESEKSASPALYDGPVRQENIQMASDGRYFLLIDENISSHESNINKTTPPSSAISRSVSPLPGTLQKQPHVMHRLVFPSRLGRIIFYRRILSDSDIYQKLCSKDEEITHNVYHLDTIRDYSMEFYMLTTYGSDSQLRAWLDSNYDTVNNTYFDDNRFQSFDDDEDYENKVKTSSSDSLIHEEELSRLQADEELDWYSELESFNLSPNNTQWKQENASSCSSDDHVGELLRAEQFSVSSLTTTSADSSCSTGLISTSWPLTNGVHYGVHSNRSSHSLESPPIENVDEQSHTILKDILTYPWTNEIANSNVDHQEANIDHIDSCTSTSIIPDEFQPDFYYLCPLKNTTNSFKTDEKTNGIYKHLSHDV